MESKLFVLPQLKLRVMFHVKHGTTLSNAIDMLLVAGGRAPQLSWLQQMVAGKALYCADRGVDVCLASRVVPLELFGDCDSSTKAAYVRATELGTMVHSFNPAKDDTDLQLLLQNLPAGDIIATGIWGGRFDHLYSNVFTLLGAKKQRQCQVLLADEQEFMLLLSAGESVELELLQKAKAISLLPLTAKAQVDFKGVRWPLNNARLEQLYPYAISNEQEADTVCCTCNSGAVGLYICWQENLESK